MTKDIWINLPAKDISKSRAFYNAMGFTQNAQHGNNEQMASFLIGDKNMVLMLFPETAFKQITGTDISNTQLSAEVMFSISAETREEVAEMAKKASEAGGIIFSKPAEVQGWMYGCGFSDLDGHRWNVLYMDMAKMPH